MVLTDCTIYEYRKLCTTSATLYYVAGEDALPSVGLLVTFSA